ncbi:MAG TPA: hypothetical protein VM261_29290 [Kofleriaceae bacterium]|nr:hypothetical protein [Kofleriaceae bacterium]
MRRSILAATRVVAAATVALAACGPKAASRPPRPATLAEQVVYDFETAVLTDKDAFVELFDFVTVGQFEILLRRYDLMGRLPDLSEAEAADLEQDDGTPYPPEREKRNVGNFYKRLAQRTVGTGDCRAEVPHWDYNKLMGQPFEELPEDFEPEEERAAYEQLRVTINEQLAKGGVIAIRCKGGTKGIALVYSERANARGYDLITIYDDGD